MKEQAVNRGVLLRRLEGIMQNITESKRQLNRCLEKYRGGAI